MAQDQNESGAMAEQGWKVSDPSPRHHVIISGTGRSGTTFLVQLLTRLRLDTGFTQADIDGGAIYTAARAGLETDVRRPNAPYVVKDPYFCEYADEVMASTDVKIDHVLVPIRDLGAAAESRRNVVRSTLAQMRLVDRIKFHLRPRELPGGLWKTRSSRVGAQEAVLAGQIYNLLLVLAGHQVPVTLLRYPRLVRDKTYCFEKLRQVLGAVEFAEFSRAFDAVARPELVHTFGSGDS